jgi:hypothetical protein
MVVIPLLFAASKAVKNDPTMNKSPCDPFHCGCPRTYMNDEAMDTNLLLLNTRDKESDIAASTFLMITLHLSDPDRVLNYK